MSQRVFDLDIDSPLGHILHKAGYSSIRSQEDLEQYANRTGLAPSTIHRLIVGELRLDPIIAWGLSSAYDVFTTWMEVQQRDDSYWTRQGVADAHLKTHAECSAIVRFRENITRMLAS